MLVELVKSGSRPRAGGSLYLFVAYLIPPATFLLLPIVFDTHTLGRLGKEDGLFENLGAVAFFGASALFLLAWLRSSAVKHTFFGYTTKRNLYFLLLSGLSFICFAEEISWGQRIFGWQTPTWLAAINVQSETTIHNLLPFSAKDHLGNRKSFFELFLNMNRLLAIFSLIYFIALPMMVRTWRTAARFVQYAGIPVPPLRIGGLFASVYLSFHAAILVFGLPQVKDLDELKEFFYAVIYALTAARAASDQVATSPATTN